MNPSFFYVGLLVAIFIPDVIYGEQLKDWHFYAETKLLSQPWPTTQAIEADIPSLLEKENIKGSFDDNLNW